MEENKINCDKCGCDISKLSYELCITDYTTEDLDKDDIIGIIYDKLLCLNCLISEVERIKASPYKPKNE